MELVFRPHHFLCALCFRGKGYSPGFINNFQTIMNLLNGETGNQIPIAITKHTDSICQPCPERRDKTCLSQEKISQLDHAHNIALDLHEVSSITWEEAKTRIKNKLTLSQFHSICAPCEWKKYGICETVLKDFLSVKKS